MKDSQKVYKHFVGIDISKNTFDIAILNQESVHQHTNSIKGFMDCFEKHRDIFRHALVVLEATGGYEKALLVYLVSQGVCVHRANPRKVKFFIKSFGVEAKSDALDAKALALYAFERQSSLTLFSIPNTTTDNLAKLVKRRGELVAIQTQEKNRLKGPDRELLRPSVENILACIKEAIATIENQIKQLLKDHPLLHQKHKTLKEVSGVGNQVASSLLANIPELGTLSGKQAASLAGVAPHPKQSGLHFGYRRVCGGRQQVKSILFLAALTAARSKSNLGLFYQRLVNNGKKPIVAIVAVMRKIIVIANAKLRDLNTSLPCYQHL